MSEIPQTELVNSRTQGLDELSTAELVQVLAEEQRCAVDAVLQVGEVLARAVDEIAARLRAGGRLHYAGAGTSGRIGILDASEMPPTFGTPPELVCAHIAGGQSAITQAVEGAEDDGEAGEREMRGHVRAGDAVVGLSASGGAAYVVRAIGAAREAGAWTLGVCNSAGSALAQSAEFAVVLNTGPEPIAGSTRLKAGTSQKILLNTLSTAVMVRLGKVHDNLMVDVVASNAKLRARALRLVMQLAQIDEPQARALLAACGGRVKIAVVAARLGLDPSAAQHALDAHGGSLRRALEQAGSIS